MFHFLIVVPCYNDADRWTFFLNEIMQTSVQKNFFIDFLVIDDGSRVEESNKIRNLLLDQKSKGPFSFEIITHIKNKGKGAALKTGFVFGLKQDRYDAIGFIDADGATPFYEMVFMLETLSKNQSIDAIIGSRVKCLGKTVQRSFKRHLMGRVFATMLSKLFNIPVYDSQCGAKVFRTCILNEKILDHAFDNRWLFDTQLLILLYRKMHRIIEQKVDWTDIPGSKVSLLRDSLRMFIGLLKFKRYLYEYKL